MFIKNDTPYIGKLKLKIEPKICPPTYNQHTVLNKTILNIGKYKIVSRMFPNKLKNEYYQLDSKKIKLMNEHTGGKIGVHEWWICTSKVTGRTKRKYTLPDKSRWDIVFHGILPESFVSKNDTYIGNVETAWFYYKNNLMVCDDYPVGVARKVDGHKQTIGFFGYNDKRSCLFKIGDRVFDKNYVPSKTDYTESQWNEFNRLKDKNNKISEIKDVIPLSLYGKLTIKTYDQARQSALNLSKYI
jgi:hypothetical protein